MQVKPPLLQFNTFAEFPLLKGKNSNLLVAYLKWKQKASIRHFRKCNPNNDTENKSRWFCNNINNYHVQKISFAT